MGSVAKPTAQWALRATASSTVASKKPDVEQIQRVTT